jgi:hypothetical protein
MTRPEMLIQLRNARDVVDTVVRALKAEAGVPVPCAGCGHKRYANWTAAQATTELRALRGKLDKWIGKLGPTNAEKKAG